MAAKTTENKELKDKYGRTAEEFGKELFECEYCYNCGKDWNEHDYILLFGGLWFAKCRIKEDTSKKGKIVAFWGHQGSGLANLIIETENGKEIVCCDNAPTVRALNALFPGFITDGHTVDNDVIKGQEIEYEMDDMGLVLAWIGKGD